MEKGEEGKKNDFKLEKQHNALSDKWSRSMATVKNHVNCILLIWSGENGALPLVVPPQKKKKIHYPSLIMRKTPDIFQ